MSGRRILCVVVVALASWGALASPAMADVFRVTRGGDPAPNGCKPRDCSLREAVIAANAAFEQDTIRLGEGTYRLTRQGDDDLSAVGDLDVIWPVRIEGQGARRTTIDGEWANNPDRLVHIVEPFSMHLVRLTMRDGDAGLPGEGGAVLSVGGSSLQAKNVNFAWNRAEYGGALALHGDGVFTRVVFTRNIGLECCAAIFNFDAVVAIRKSAFLRNNAVEDSAAIYNEGDRMIIRDSLFAHNIAGTNGGALTHDGPNLELYNSTFSGNIADESGGAISLSSNSGGQLNNVTVTRNYADADDDGVGDGGGIFSQNNVAVSLRNTIVSANVDLGGEAPNCTMFNPPAFVSAGFNLFGDMTGCTFDAGVGDRVSTPPGLQPLRDNGGFTRTHALRKGSKALNRGSEATPGSNDPTACTARDQRGVKRPQRGRCDIGAFELK